MSTRIDGGVCWYCLSDADEPCEACDEVNAIFALLPDCTDGKVSVAQLVATWRAVWDEDNIIGTDHGGRFLDADYLHSVRP